MKQSSIIRLAQAAIASLLVAAAVAAAPVTQDVTWFSVSDLHYGVTTTVVAANQATIDAMNTAPGLAYPAALGGTVAAPMGVTITGDLTNDSQSAQWTLFATDYGVNGENRIKYPVFEGWGNHDGSPAASTSYITGRIKARNLLRQNLTKVSSNGYHYSWDRGNVHFVHCNLYPGDTIIADGQYDGNAHQPLYSLQFLKDDLAQNVGDSGRPVVIFSHFGMDGWGITWWSATEQTNFANAIKNYNVVAVLCGHDHAASSYTWSGLNYFNCASAQRDSTTNPGKAGEFLIFHISQNSLTYAHRFTDHWGTLVGTKAIQTKPGKIAYLKNIPDGAAVVLTGKTVTAAAGQGGVPTGQFYIEDPSRCAAVQVKSSTAVAVGSSVNVTGTLLTNAGGERYISATSVSLNSATGPAVTPVFATTKDLADKMMDGLLIRAAGTVKTVGTNYFTLVDGYSNVDTGIDVETKVMTGTAPGVTEGQLVNLTGIAARSSARVIYKLPVAIP